MKAVLPYGFGEAGCVVAGARDELYDDLSVEVSGNQVHRAFGWLDLEIASPEYVALGEGRVGALVLGYAEFYAFSVPSEAFVWVVAVEVCRGGFVFPPLL